MTNPTILDDESYQGSSEASDQFLPELKISPGMSSVWVEGEKN